MKEDLVNVIACIVKEFSNYRMDGFFRNSGYTGACKFDPAVALESEVKTLGF